MDSPSSERPGYFFNVRLDSYNSTAVKNQNSDAKELVLGKYADKGNNKGNCPEDPKSYMIDMNREPDEGAGIRGDGKTTTGDEVRVAGALTRDEMSHLNDNMRHVRVSSNYDNNWQATGVRDNQRRFRLAQELESLRTTDYQEQAEPETDLKLAETSQNQRPIVRGRDSNATDRANETRLQQAIGLLEENLDQLRSLHVKQEIDKSRHTLEVDPVEHDHDLINCLRRDLFSYEQQLLTIQSDLQLAQQNIDVLKTEKLNMAAELAYERQMGALCLQTVTDRLTRISVMMETGNDYSSNSSSSPGLTPVQQAVFKTELGRLVKVLELEELRLTESLRSNTSGDTDKQLANNCVCLKPVEQSTDSKYSSTGVFHQKRFRPTSVGMVRCRSAPVKSTSPSMSLLNSSGLGQGKDYFKILYNDVKLRQGGGMTRTSNHQSDRNFTSELLARSPSSALHDLHIIEIQPDGKFVRIANSSNTVDYQIGNYILQQNTEGHPVAVYRFPPRVHCPALATVTVWSEGCEAALHHPPSNFIFTGKHKWSTGSRVSTILCRPNGQAVAWSTALAKQYFQQPFFNYAAEKEVQELPKATSSESFVFDREKTTMENSPDTTEALISLEPQASDTVIKTSSKRNAIPGLPFAGASGRRLGSASLRRYQARPLSATQL